MSKISEIKARQIIDSRGNPTIEADVILSSGKIGRAAIPSGASIGSKEAIEIRDGDEKLFSGKGVLDGVAKIHNVIAPKLKNVSVLNQEKIDQILIDLDGTKNKSNLGANAILAVSLACAKAAAESKKKQLFQQIGEGTTLPIPMMNIINGGAHANNALSIQEFMIMPAGFESFSEALRCGCEIFYQLKDLLSHKYSTNIGDEGGFAPNLKNSKQALDFIAQATEKAGYELGRQVFLSLDCAANEFFKNGKYELSDKKGKNLSSSELVDFYADLTKKYPIISIEDPMSEQDRAGWEKITQVLGDSIQIVGDDLFVTNKEILKNGHENHLANSILIKPNQIGTLTETMQTIDFARQIEYNSIISHRSGETEDVSIAHIAVATNAGQIKTGSVCRIDRVAKYNELLRIEEMLGNKAVYAGSVL